MILAFLYYSSLTLALPRKSATMKYMSVEATHAIDYLGIHEAFAESEYGVTLAANVRYAKYKPAEMANERWEELLGPDVNNLAHLADTYHLAADFVSRTDRLQPGLLSQRDKAALKISAIIHDWGESIIPDINYFEKTDADEAAERQVFADNLPNFYTGGDGATQELIAEAAETIIFDRESRLGNIFNVIERIGYLRTGLRAAEHVREGSAPDCHSHLRWLAASVMSSDHTTCLVRQSDLLAAQYFLALRQVSISEAFDASQDPAIFTSLEPEQAAVRGQGLHEARVVWGAWCAGREF